MQTILRALNELRDDLKLFSWGWYVYLEKKIKRFGARFETQKGAVVDILMARRGTYQRPFLHLSLSIILLAGILSAPILANSYPGGLPADIGDYTPPSAVLSSFDLTEYGVETQESKKPRDQVLTYIVEKGDTLASIADKFGISVDTIKWVSDIKGDSLSIKQELKIPPVTGVVHKVKEGETVYSIAKTYKTDAQKIVNFPFNDFTDLDTFALAAGQTLVVPDGVKREAPAIYIPAAPIFAGGSGQFQWPTGGVITQYPIWYHMALDIANSSAPGIGAAGSGTVATVEKLRFGYGQYVIIGHGDGLSTLYAHMSDIYVKSGDSVARGQLIGRMGSTGKSTGTHLHFEVRKNGTIVNPLPFLK